MNKLYNHPKVKCMVSFTHGEGFGRPLLEASFTGLPIIASGWSGQLDFLSPKHSVLLGGELKKVPKSIVWKDVIVPESQWFNINETQAYNSFNHAFKNIDDMVKSAKILMKNNRGMFTLNNMVGKLDDIMIDNVSNIPSQVSLNLPKLKKKSKTEQPKIKLPKLKKVTDGVNV